VPRRPLVAAAGQEAARAAAATDGRAAARPNPPLTIDVRPLGGQAPATIKRLVSHVAETFSSVATLYGAPARCRPCARQQSRKYYVTALQEFFRRLPP